MRWIIFIIIYILVDIYAFQAFRTFVRQPWLNVLYIAISVGLLGMFIYQLSYGGGSSRTMTPFRMYAFGVFLAIFVPKLLLIGFMFAEDIVRIFVAAFNKIGGNAEGFHLPSRRKFLSGVALGVAAVPFLSLLYGMWRGKYQYQVLRHTLVFDDLPDAFDGYTITQISDVHSGSFDNEEKVRYGISLINEQQSDAILFTGDLVNNLASEMDRWKELFGSLRAKDGVFSVLGNHDYGDYVDWSSSEEKENNLARLKALQGEMGWDLLLNEHRMITRNNESIALVGVENWGAGGFKKAGDLSKACEGVATSDFKILMSHDPSHWQEEVKSSEKNIQLTLSGHTHGMQFGIEIPGLIKWSPVKYRYENWAGMYEDLGRYIHVNRGFGFLGYPGRVGIWPEVTVITLKKRAAKA
ncbi:metallophosphoesterase [Altibacter sp. HG106]|uniref:metallophosphoesterase n=1 Tax=Altibacter sp. HG106 TaxID=3023937 RepID=UPI0023505112|nr:metallophosphoesterase [Altibacter sp. HG106]MDC7994720.1 metallophosphoesterase [Altibacter sp. HG106]